jgi:hypothetical protein
VTRALLVIGGAAAAAAYVTVEIGTRWANLDARLDRLERIARAEHRLESSLVDRRRTWKEGGYLAGLRMARAAVPGDLNQPARKAITEVIEGASGVEVEPLW